MKDKPDYLGAIKYLGVRVREICGKCSHRNGEGCPIVCEDVIGYYDAMDDLEDQMKAAKKDEKKYMDYLAKKTDTSSSSLVPFLLYNAESGKMDRAAFTPSGVAIVTRGICKVGETA